MISLNGRHGVPVSPIPAPPISASTRAKNDALKAIAREIPDPKAYAHQASLLIVECLLAAYLRNGNEWIAASETDAEQLRPYGLADFGSRGLTTFAIQVRKVLKEEDA